MEIKVQKEFSPVIIKIETEQELKSLKFVLKKARLNTSGYSTKTVEFLNTLEQGIGVH